MASTSYIAMHILSPFKMAFEWQVFTWFWVHTFSYKVYFKNIFLHLSIDGDVKNSQFRNLIPVCLCSKGMHQHSSAVSARTSSVHITNYSISDTKCSSSHAHVSSWPTGRWEMGFLKDLSLGLFVCSGAGSAAGIKPPWTVPQPQLSFGKPVLGKDWWIPIWSYRLHQAMDKRLPFHLRRRFFWTATISHVKFVN